MNGQPNKKDYHELNIRMRKEMTVNGVSEVVSFDEQDIHLITTGGDMFIEGSDMKIDILDVDKGVVTLNGKIDAIYYSNDDKKEKNGFLGKLFR